MSHEVNNVSSAGRRKGYLASGYRKGLENTGACGSAVTQIWGVLKSFPPEISSPSVFPTGKGPPSSCMGHEISPLQPKKVTGSMQGCVGEARGSGMTAIEQTVQGHIHLVPLL